MTKPQAHALVIEDAIWMLNGYRAQSYLPIFTVTDHPSDWPDHYVARLHLTGKDGAQATTFAIMDTSLERLQITMEALGLVKLHRSPEDDPVILESWL